MINEKMKNDLVALGIKSDDTILMHSSLSSLGYVEGGADTVIDTLLDILTDGTLLIPTLSYATVTADSPVFSIKDTPSCVGKIGNVFREREGVIRSMHPTHSVAAYGKYAKEITEGHINTNTPVGELSPFALLPKYNGKVLMLGCTIRPNTSFHGIEEKAGVWYALSKDKREYTLIDENGKQIKKEYYYHYIGENGFEQRYARIENLYKPAYGKVLEADCYLFEAAPMWEAALKAISENEEYFVEKRA